MALLHLSSNNPEFSFAVSKNPESGPLVKSIGHGHAFGYFSSDDNQTYSVYFKDHPKLVTFKAYREETVEFMNATRFNSVMCYLRMITGYFNSLYKDGSEYEADGKFENVLEIPLVNLDRKRYSHLFPSYLTDFDLELTELFNKNYQVKITTKRSLSDLLNYSALFFVMNAISNEDSYFEGADEQLTKYISSMVRLNAPYFMRYLFKTSLLGSEKRFNQNKEALEQSEANKIEMVYGSTQEQRLRAVSALMVPTHGIVEIGCGEGFMTIPLAVRAARNDQSYYAIDVNPDCRQTVERRIKRKELENVTVLESWADFTQLDNLPEKLDMMCVEVIEHLEVSDATDLAVSIVNFCKAKARTVVFTTPNRNFNQFYALQGFRHDDHKFEFDQNEFLFWVMALVDETELTKENVRFFGIGDKVDGIPTTQAVQFTFGR